MTFNLGFVTSSAIIGQVKNNDSISREITSGERVMKGFLMQRVHRDLDTGSSYGLIRASGFLFFYRMARLLSPSTPTTLDLSINFLISLLLQAKFSLFTGQEKAISAFY